MAVETEGKTGGKVARQRWGSRAAFLLASVGSAVGLGNVWRFPWLSYEYGGGVFLIPYFLALLFLGLPLLMVELGVGRTFQRGDVEAFGRVHRRLRGVGVMSVLGSFLIVTYYVSIVAWSLVYFVASFEHPLPWKGKQGNFDDSRDFLYNDVLHLASEEQLDSGKSHVIAGYVFGGLVVTWATIFFSIAFGVKGVSKVVAITVPLPILLLLVLLIYNSTLEGAGDGVEAYIGKWDLSDLGQKSIWPVAAGQIYFSNSLGTGVMTAFGSFTGEESNIVMDTTIISLSNSAVSIFAGFVVYTIIGNVAHNFNENIDETADSSGPSLAFVTYPTGLLSFGKGVSNLMSAIFFLTLFTLGIDSAFSLVEALTTVLRDTGRFRKVNSVHVTAYTCMIGFVISILFATDIGLYLLSSVDHMMLTYGLLIMGLVKVIGVSWVFGFEDMVERVGKRSASIYTYGYGLAVAVGILLSSALWPVMDDHLYFVITIPVGILVFIAATFLAYAMRKDKHEDFNRWFHKVRFTGTEYFRHTINEKAEKYGNWKLPYLWDFFVKYLNPPMLAGLIVNGIFNDATDEDGEFYNFPGWVQAIGIMSVGVIFLAFVVLAFWPSLWTTLMGDPGHEEEQAPIGQDGPDGLSKTALKAPLTQGAHGSSAEITV